MKRFAALALMTAATGAAVAMAASPAAADHKGYDGYYVKDDLQRTVVEHGHGHGHGYWWDKDGKDRGWGDYKEHGYYY